MKPKTLFLTWMVCQLAVSVYAERQKPMVTNYPVETIEIDGKSEYYMYNTGAKKFWTGANLWGTQASVGPIGWKVRFSQHVSVKDKAWDGKTVLLEDFAMNRTWLKAWFVADANIIYTDYYGQADYFWCIQKVGDAYRLSASALNPNPTVAGYANKYVGIDATKEDSVLYSDLTESETNHIDWIFFNATAYDDALDLYEDVQFLLKRITEAEEKGLDVTAQKQVYDNDKATAEEVAAAITAVNKAISEYEENSVDPYNPIDKTGVIINPSYDANTNDGWSGTTPGFQSFTDAEHYNKTFDSYQVIENVPNGVYKMSVQGFYRPATSGATGAVFYAVGGDSLTVNVPDLSSAVGIASLPGNMQQAEEAFVAGYYVTELYFVVTNNTAKIGVTLPALTGSSDWVIWDNWQLKYYGNKGEASFNGVVKEMIDAYLTRFDTITEKMSTGIVDAYKTTISNLATDLAGINEAKQTIENAIYAVEANISAWKDYQKDVEEVKIVMSEDYEQLHWNDASRKLYDYIQTEAPTYIEDLGLTTEKLLAQIAYLSDMKNKAFIIGHPTKTVWSYVSFEQYSNEFNEIKERNSYTRYLLDSKEWTNIGQASYHKLVEYTTCEYEEGQETNAYRIRWEGNRVYIHKEDAPDYADSGIILKEEGDDYLLYDFNLNVGDEFCKWIHEGDTTSITVSEISFVTTIEGETFKAMRLSMGTSWWIERFGSTTNFLYYIFPDAPTCVCGSSLNYAYEATVHSTISTYKNPFGDITAVSTAFKADDCALGADAIEQIIKEQKSAQVQAIGQILLCTSPDAVKLEVYTMDAVKVGEAAFANGEATVKVGKTPATYLYIVTYPNGRRESGKTVM
ncbi:MAG: hypothetical protein IJ013_09785 [Bacteroidaceae bacterium]|nr:hypothetical protein [Bacteroidaceae bacterium]